MKTIENVAGALRHVEAASSDVCSAVPQGGALPLAKLNYASDWVQGRAQ